MAKYGPSTADHYCPMVHNDKYHLKCKCGWSAGPFDRWQEAANARWQHHLDVEAEIVRRQYREQDKAHGPKGASRISDDPEGYSADQWIKSDKED